MNAEKKEFNQPVINDSGFLEYGDRVYASEAEVMKEKGGEIMENLENILHQPVDKVAKKYGVSFVHGTHPNFTPDTSAQKDKMTWDQKIRKVMDEGPEISCSSVSAGDSSENLWAGVGVIVKKGTIKNAFVQDLGTVVDDGGDRQSVAEDEINKTKSLSQKVPDAINRRSKNAYNEFVIANPEVAGIYFDLGMLAQSGDARTQSQAHISLKEFFERGSQLDSPKYLFYQGNFYEPVQEEIEVEAVVDSRHDFDPAEFKTWPRISRSELEKLRDKGIFISGDYVESSSESKLLYDEIKPVKFSAIRLGQQVDVYDDKKEKNN